MKNILFQKTPVNLSPKKLFLLDSLGALLSAAFLGLVLARFEAAFGMPKAVLYALSFIAFLFSVYSFFCFLYLTKNWKTYLRVIAIANLLYACLTIGLVSYYYQKITALGFWYFFIEITIMLALAALELKIASALYDNSRLC